MNVPVTVSVERECIRAKFFLYNIDPIGSCFKLEEELDEVGIPILQTCRFMEKAGTGATPPQGAQFGPPYQIGHLSLSGRQNLIWTPSNISVPCLFVGFMSIRSVQWNIQGIRCNGHWLRSNVFFPAHIFYLQETYLYHNLTFFLHQKHVNRTERSEAFWTPRISSIYVVLHSQPVSP